MSHFILSDDEQEAINADHVVRVINRRPHAVGSTIELDDDQYLYSSLNARELCRQSQPVVKADPGYFLLSAFFQEDEEEPFFVCDEPIVAWRISEENIAEPITLDEEPSGFNLVGTGIYKHGGGVTQPYDATFSTRESWEKAMKEKAKTKREEWKKERTDIAKQKAAAKK